MRRSLEGSICRLDMQRGWPLCEKGASVDENLSAIKCHQQRSNTSFQLSCCCLIMAMSLLRSMRAVTTISDGQGARGSRGSLSIRPSCCDDHRLHWRASSLQLAAVAFLELQQCDLQLPRRRGPRTGAVVVDRLRLAGELESAAEAAESRAQEHGIRASSLKDWISSS
jgi:hypothetical protein